MQPRVRPDPWLRLEIEDHVNPRPAVWVLPTQDEHVCGGVAEQGALRVCLEILEDFPTPTRAVPPLCFVPPGAGLEFCQDPDGLDPARPRESHERKALRNY